MLTFTGHSDDVLTIGGDDSDEVGCYDKEAQILVGSIAEGVRVRAVYAPESSGAVWRISAELTEEDALFPWPVRYERGHGYSLSLVIDCPKGTRWADERSGKGGA